MFNFAGHPIVSMRYTLTHYGAALSAFATIISMLTVVWLGGRWTGEITIELEMIRHQQQESAMRQQQALENHALMRAVDTRQTAILEELRRDMDAQPPKWMLERLERLEATIFRHHPPTPAP